MTSRWELSPLSFFQKCASENIAATVSNAIRRNPQSRVDGTRDHRCPRRKRTETDTDLRPAPGHFDRQKQADTYALELAKLWIDGRTWGTNGHG